MDDRELHRLRIVAIAVAFVCGVIMVAAVAVMMASVVLGDDFPWIVLAAAALVALVLVRAVRRYRAAAGPRR